MNLPREIVKWIHGLDLSYSVTSAYKDLCNGFLVAEIFTRYYPQKIQMFSLENSQKLDQKKSNWIIIQNFIKKFEIEIKEFDIRPIVDGDKAKLLDFII